MRKMTYQRVSGGPMIVTFHSNMFESSTRPAEKPSTGLLDKSAQPPPLPLLLSPSPSNTFSYSLPCLTPCLLLAPSLLDFVYLFLQRSEIYTYRERERERGTGMGRGREEHTHRSILLTFELFAQEKACLSVSHGHSRNRTAYRTEFYLKRNQH